MSLARIRALSIVGVLVAAAVVVVVMTLVKDQQSQAKEETCPKDAVIADTRMPTEDQVKVNVYNATDKPGLANDVATDLNNRKFQATKQDVNPNPKPVEGIALIRYGPKTVGGAWLLRAYLLNEAKAEFDIQRNDDVVDLVVGPGFKQLATFTEKNQALAAVGRPKLPPGTCAVEEG